MSLKDKLKEALELDDLDVVTVEGDEKLAVLVIVKYNINQAQQTAIQDGLDEFFNSMGMGMRNIRGLIISGTDIEVKLVKEKA